MNKRLLIGILGSICVCMLLVLSGCETTTTPSASGAGAKLQGTWQGSLPLSMGRENSTLTQVTFSGSTATLMLASDFGTRTMNYTYNCSADSLVLQPVFGQGFGRQWNGSMPSNGTRPPGNGTWPGNGTRPDWNGSNWTRPPGNETWPGNGSMPPRDRQFSMTFSYSLEGDTVLYLDSVPFTKVS